MKEYVAGLLFSKSSDAVVLIQKKKGPPTVVGKWNALGGKVEPGESALAAMHRETIEEAGVNPEWTQFLVLKGVNWQVTFFVAHDDAALMNAHTKEEEPVGIFYIDLLPLVVPNLSWIIPMALNYQNDNVHSYVVWEVAA